MQYFKNSQADSVNYPLIFSSICAIPVLATLLYGALYPDDFKSLGNWGDFFGGLMTPILTFATVVGLLYTINLQRDELSLTREELFRSATALESQHSEMKKQSFESRFFNMLEFHSSIVSQLHLYAYSKESTGRDVFNSLYQILAREYRKHLDSVDPSDFEPLDFEAFYEQYWHIASDAIGHYYRYLFNLIRFVANNSNDADLYVKLIRAQFTDRELILLFYNTKSRHGKSFESFISSFSLFDNLRKDLLFDKGHEIYL